MLPTVGLRTHIWNNFIKSGLLLAGFPLLLLLATFALVLLVQHTGKGLWADMAAAAETLPVAFPVALLVSGIWFGIAWLGYQPIINAVTGARPVTREQEPRLWNLLENLCISRGLTMPALAIIETPGRNAFASGLSRRGGQVTVTRGLMEALDDRELEAVLAHELTHIRNGDARLGVIAAVFAGIISLVAEVVFRGMRGVRVSGGGNRGRGGGAAVLVALAVLAVAWLLAVVLRFALSRNREFLADAGAVELTANPDAMISALRKVEGRSDIPGMPSQVQAMLLDWPQGTRGFSLWATHPSIEARVQALVAFAGGRDPGPVLEPRHEEAAPEGAAPGAPRAESRSPWWRGPAA
ncbi:MAG: M48 family metallopeptidase [Acetobacteraceae bacterium]|nr:M48 family metallopeptidase [Acetobacteraceae bacterium]